jgi:hypothetical protein
MPYLVRMRTILRPAAAALVLFAALAATGCTPGPAKPQTPAPSSTPLFASDEEALAAAKEAYAAYLAVVDGVLQDGGRDTTALSDVAVGDALDQALADAREFQAMGYRTVGSTQIGQVRLQSNNMKVGTDGVVIRAYVCEDVSQVGLFDNEGRSVVSPERPTVTPFQAAFVSSQDSADVIVSERTVWEDLSACG